MDCRDIDAAVARLRGNIHNVEVSSSKTFSQMSNCDVFLKCENRQKTGSFKIFSSSPSASREIARSSRIRSSFPWFT